MSAEPHLPDLARRLPGTHRNRYKPRGFLPAVLLWCPKCDQLRTRVQPKQLRTFCSSCPKPAPQADDAERAAHEVRWNKVLSRTVTRRLSPTSTWVRYEHERDDDPASLNKWSGGSPREIERAVDIRKGRPVLRAFPYKMLELHDRSYAFFVEQLLLMGWIKSERAVELPFFDPQGVPVPALRERLRII